MMRTALLAGVLAAVLLPPARPLAAEQPQAGPKPGAWSSDRMRLTPRARPPAGLPGRPPAFHDELDGNCAGLKVMIRTRMEWLKDIERQAAPPQWPPQSAVAQWERRPMGDDIARERERIAKLNAALGAKGCPTVDVEAELKNMPYPTLRTQRK